MKPDGVYFRILEMDTPLKTYQEILFWYFQKICYISILGF